MERKAPNRVLDLGELMLPFYRRTIAGLKELCAKEKISYLHPSKQWEYPWALSRAGCTPGDSVLDAGCGASIFPVYLARLGCRVIALDRGKAPRLDRIHRTPFSYLRAEITELPLGEGTFDTVFSISVIEHLDPPGAEKAMRELARVLRPGGRLLLTTDYARDRMEEMWYCGEGEPFRVDWSVFDEPRLVAFLNRCSKWFEVDGALDLRVDWKRTRTAMRRFHGYPYTSVGVCLRKTE
jgi:SAM-dependent methyltransferase